MKTQLNTKVLSLVKEESPALSFNVVEIGARQVSPEYEPFHELVAFFPDSRYIGFDIDQAVCEELNANSPAFYEYFPYAIGKQNGPAKFYQTRDPMCSSLLEPNTSLLSRYNGMESAFVEEIIDIDTITIDDFLKSNAITHIDALKIDVQGAELDVFLGAEEALQSILGIVSEVEFVELYRNQPLFGDISKHLAKRDLMFHKFLGMGTRNLKPVLFDGSIEIGSQHLWADALFIKNLPSVIDLSSDELLKLGLIAFVYGSVDVTNYCFEIYSDQVKGAELHQSFMETLSEP